MARSNGPMTPPGPGAGRTQRPDPQSWAQGTTPSQPASRTPQSQQPFAQQQPFTPQSAGAAYHQAAYGGHQAQPAADPRYARPQQAGEPRAAAPQPATSSAFDNFVAQQSPGGYGGHAATPAYDQQPYPSLNTGTHNPGHAQAQGYGESADQGGFGQWANPAPAADARGFDYGTFDAAQPAGGHYGQTAHTAYGGQNHAVGHGHDQGHGGEWGQGGYDENALVADGYDHAGYGPQQPQYGQAADQAFGDQAYDDYEVEPRRRRKMPLIAAAVVAAVLCGGGLAYGYKTLLGPVPSGDTPLIKTSSIPSKVKPDDPGGRKFGRETGGSKIMGEPLGDAAGGGQSDGARKVQTVEVRPDGSVVASSSPSSGNSSSGPMAANAMGFPTAGDTGVGAPHPSPQVVAKAEPPPQVAAAEAAEDVVAPPPAAPPKKVQSKKVAAAAAPQGSIGPTPTGAGWVAVLASVPISSNSQMDSLKQFADMQQKYNDVLGDKTPSVQEADLGEKGRYHRLVVGPPGSRDSASSVCGSLKTAGYSGCWVMQY